jgi:hypothetical protein
MAKRQSKEQYLAGNNKRRQILSICHQLPTDLMFTEFSPAKGKRVIDMYNLDQFLCGDKSIYKKPLNFHTPEELSKVIIQFENMLKGYLRK